MIAWPENLIAALGLEYRRTRVGWVFQCPVHDDKHPSATIRIGDTGIAMVQCFVCKKTMRLSEYFKAFCAATNTVPRQWCNPEHNFSREKLSGNGRPSMIPVATYDYTDHQGKLLFQVCRFAKPSKVPFKARRPVRPDDDAKIRDGSWVWEGLGRAVEAQVPYRLKDILARPDQPVLICEGEKDADRLAALGFVATTNAFGAGNWNFHHANHLIGRRCVILEDNDEAGERHTQLVAGSLLCVGVESIRVVRFTELPEHGDVSDWLDSLKLPDAELKRKIIERVKSAPLWGRVQAA